MAVRATTATWTMTALAAVMLGIASAQDGPATAIVIEELPFVTSEDSTGFSNTVELGGGPDVFFAFTSTTEVRREGKKNKCVCLELKNCGTCGGCFHTRTSQYPSTRAGPPSIP